MARFCGNCGAEIAEGDRVCGQCGVPIVQNRNATTAIPGVDYVNPEKKKFAKKLIIGIGSVAIVIIVLVMLANYLSGFLGYKGVVRKLMNAYQNYDIEVFTSMASELYYSMENDSAAEEYFETIVSNDLDSFEETVGHKYKFSYEITDSYNLSKHKFEELLDQLSVYEDFDTYIISEVMIVEVEITVEGEEKGMTKIKELHLTKEDGDWRILYFY